MLLAKLFVRMRRDFFFVNVLVRITVSFLYNFLVSSDLCFVFCLGNSEKSIESSTITILFAVFPDIFTLIVRPFERLFL